MTHKGKLSSAISFALIVGVLGACSESSGVTASDINQACGGEDVSAIPPKQLSPTDRVRNAEAAEKRFTAAQRIAEADARFKPLAEALGIISDAAQTLRTPSELTEPSIDWDLVKMAQAAAADQCELLFSQQTAR